jgi:hypothetical protein
MCRRVCCGENLIRVDGSDKAVSNSGERLDIETLVYRITQGISEFLYCCVEAVLEINESLRRPELLPQLVPGDHIARMTDESVEHLQGLGTYLQLDSVLTQLAQMRP